MTMGDPKNPLWGSTSRDLLQAVLLASKIGQFLRLEEKDRSTPLNSNDGDADEDGISGDEDENDGIENDDVEEGGNGDVVEV